ncbi:PREDICTED: uncharacterized protein LOC104800162 [Tarenaya hassleriana]|uniref:uncharacterized protein LOC104800162 n=1 Tax=Tarenaya hassleriana TaxID=28532 RepID=UPI00053C36D8|nr:PREDICTED: uncharacterized protein LOC104800162 [Tarenaya hassleriana]
MLLGKRQRPPMKRTTSMSEITIDLNLNLSGESEPSDQQKPSPSVDLRRIPYGQNGQLTTAIDQPRGHHGLLDQRLLAAVSPRGLQRRHSADYNSNAAHFLRSCYLCKRQLVPGHDIYMYRGDRAFCSSECREKQMKQDEKKEKSAFAAKKESAAVVTTAANANAGSGNGERAAAAV